MPVNFLQLRQQITEMGSRTQEYETRRETSLARARAQLQEYAHRGHDLCVLVDQAAQANQRLRCAVPTQDHILEAVDPQPCPPAGMVLAADGSQVSPSRHDPFPIGVINVGAYQWIPGSIPQEFQDTRLLYFDEVHTQNGLLSEGMIALMRDLDERKIMARLAKDKPQPVMALTDGPLELFYEARESEEFRRALKEYLDSLHELESMGVAAAGYVDRPLSDLVVRLLELTLVSEDHYAHLERNRALQGVLDEELFGELLKPGQRSAVFAIKSQQTANFKGTLALHFFYLNAGRDGKPALARVELPAWVAENRDLLNLLHCTLVDQCAMLGANPYPYCLHRAHEIALVGFDEKRRIMDMIAVEHLNQGQTVQTASFKQSNKDLDTSRTRYK